MVSDKEFKNAMARRFANDASATQAIASASDAIAAGGHTARTSGGPMPALHGYAGDVAGLLPPLAKERLEKLRTARDQGGRVTQSIAVDLMDLFTRRGLAYNRVRELQDDFRLDAQDPRLIDARERHAALVAEQTQLEKQQSDLHAANQPIAQLVETVEQYLKNMRGIRSLIDYKMSPPLVKKPETISTAIDAARHRLRILGADEHAVRSAPVHSDEARKRAHAALDALAALGTPDVSNLLDHDGTDQILWQTVQRQVVAETFLPSATGSPTRAATFLSLDAVDPVALLCWAHKAAMHRSIDELIKVEAADEEALSAEDRAAKLAVIASDKLMIERREIALIDMATAEGLVIGYRPETNPLALLQVTVQG